MELIVSLGCLLSDYFAVWSLVVNRNRFTFDLVMFPLRSHAHALSLDLIAPHRIRFCIESKFSSPLTSTTKFKQYIADALLDMRAICEAGLDSGEGPESKGGHGTEKESGDGIEARVLARL